MAEESIAFDRAADFYDETRGFPAGVAQPVGELIARTGRMTGASRVLEIGVGTGRIALPVSAHVAGYFGIDLSTQMMGRLLAKRNGEPLAVAQADATRLPFADDTFDVAVAVHVFHLIPGWQQAMAEVGRVLRTGAPLLLCWNGGREDPRVKPLWDAWNAAIPPERRAPVGARPDDDPSFAENEGWTKVGDEQTYEYATVFSPKRHLDRLRRRVWSRLWRLTDEEIATGTAAVQTAIVELFDDPTAEVPQVGMFHVQAYQLRA